MYGGDDMTLMELDEFLFMCEEVGFKSLSEVNELLKRNGVTWKDLYVTLDNILTKKYGKEVEELWRKHSE